MPPKAKKKGKSKGKKAHVAKKPAAKLKAAPNKAKERSMAKKEATKRASTGESKKAHGTVEDLHSIHQQLSADFEDMNRRITEYKVVVHQGLSQSVGIMEDQAKRINEMLQANLEVSHNAQNTAKGISRHEEEQHDLDITVQKLMKRRAEMEANVERLRGERDNLTETLNKLDSEHADSTKAINKLNTRIDRLRSDCTSLTKENSQKDKMQNKLEIEVRGLEELKERYLQNIARFRDKKDELTSS